MKSLLVTGGAGFIGSCFVKQLLRDPLCEVCVLDKLTYAGNLESLREVADCQQLHFNHGDVCDGELNRRLLAQHKPQAVVHFAAETHVDRSIASPEDFVTTNVVGTFRLLEAALKYWEDLSDHGREQFRFLQISTDEVYGSLDSNGTFVEESVLAPNSPYSASKAAADHLVRAFHQTYKLPTLTVRCSNNFGPFQFPEKLIPRMVMNAISGRPLPVYGDGSHIREWLFVEDCCRAIESVLERGTPGDVYNVGGGTERTNLELVRLICSQIDRLAKDLTVQPTEKLIHFVADRLGHDYRYALNYNKLSQQLGWRPTSDFEESLEKTICWYLNNLDWVKIVEKRSRVNS